MHLYFNIDNKLFRYYVISSDNNNIYESITTPKEKDILSHITNTIEYVDKKFRILSISIALPGIIKKNKIYEAIHLKLSDGQELQINYKDIIINYINNGDAYVIGETYNTLLSPKNKNILGIVFGNNITGGLIINGNIVLNSEISQIFESFMKEQYLIVNNIDILILHIAHELSKLIKLLNLNYILISGYVCNFKNFEKILNEKVCINNFNNTKILIRQFSQNKILEGLQIYSHMKNIENMEEENKYIPTAFL